MAKLLPLRRYVRRRSSPEGKLTHTPKLTPRSSRVHANVGAQTEKVLARLRHTSPKQTSLHTPHSSRQPHDNSFIVVVDKLLINHHQ